MELFRNAKISCAETKLEAQLNGFKKYSPKQKDFNSKRSSSTGQIKPPTQQRIKINELYTNKEIQNLKKVIKTNPFDSTSQIFMREVRKQEAQKNHFCNDDNHFLNRSTYRSLSRNFEENSIIKTRNNSINNTIYHQNNNISSQKKRNFSQDQYDPLQQQSNNNLNTTNNNNNSNGQVRFLNKNMGACFTSKGSARNFNCLKYRIVKYQEDQDILEQKKLKGQGYKMKNNSQTHILKSQLTSALISFKEFKDSKEIDHAVKLIANNADGNHNNNNHGDNQNKDQSQIKNNNNNSQSKTHSFFAYKNNNNNNTTQNNIQDQKKNEELQKIKKDAQDESPWMTSFTSRKTMINEVKQINKRLFEMKQNTKFENLKEQQQQQQQQQKLQTEQSSSNNNKNNNEENQIQSEQQLKQQIDPDERPIYFDVNTGKRQLGVTENERKQFANFLADKNLNVLLYCRKFDVEPNGHLKKHLNQIIQQNTINEQIRNKFNQQMIDDQLESAVKKEQKIINSISQQQQIIQSFQSSIQQQCITGNILTNGELTPNKNNQITRQQIINSSMSQNKNNNNNNENNNNLSSRRSSILINDENNLSHNLKQNSISSILKRNKNETEFVSVGQFLKKQNEQQYQQQTISPLQNKRSQSASLIQSKRINTILHQQSKNIKEMKQIKNLMRQKSQNENNNNSEYYLNGISPISKLHIPLIQSESVNYKSINNQDKSQSMMQFEPSPSIVNGIKGISPIKKRGESTLKFSSQIQIYNGDFDIQTKFHQDNIEANEEDEQDNDNQIELNQQNDNKLTFDKTFSNFSQAYQIKMKQQQQQQLQQNVQQEQQDQFMGFIKNNTKAQSSFNISDNQRGSQTYSHRSNKNNTNIKRNDGSQTSKNMIQTANSLAHIQEMNSMNQLTSSQYLKNRSRSIINDHLKKSQQLFSLLFEEQKHIDLAKEQDQTLLEKYKYLVSSEKMTRINLKKERRKQKGISQKLPKKIFDEIGFVYGRNPFLKFKPAKLMKIRLSIIKYLHKVKLLNINIFEIVEKKIYPLNPYERPGAYIFLNLCKNGTGEQIEEMLKNNQYHVHDFNELNQTGLHIAAYNDNTEVCLVLLKYFSDPDLIDSTGKTPLYYALRNQNNLLVRYLFFYQSSPWSRQDLKYCEIEMDDDIKIIFDTARIVHFMIQLPYKFNEKIWDVFLKDPIPKMLNSDDDDDEDDEDGDQNDENDDGQEGQENNEEIQSQSLSNQQNSKTINKNNNNQRNKRFQSQSSLISQNNDQNLKYASINSITPFNERQSIDFNHIQNKNSNNNNNKNKNINDNDQHDDQDQYYGDLFRAQNYS